MATLAPPYPDLPSHVWCVTNKNINQHFTVRGPTQERSSPKYILSFTRRYHADVFRRAVCFQKTVERDWPRIALQPDYGLVIPDSGIHGTTNIDLDVHEMKLVELLDKCNMSGVSISLIDDFRAFASNLEFRGSKVNQSAVLKMEDYRKHLNDILRA